MKKLVLSCSLVLSACSLAPEQGSSVKNENQNEAVSMKLYSEINVTPSDFCDRHIAMELAQTESGYQADVEYALAGSCEVAVIPNARTYSIADVTTGVCGQKLLKGKSADGSKSIEIIDNRTNTCEVVLPALFVVNETIDNVANKLYSHDPSIEYLSQSDAFEMVCSQNDTSATPYMTFIVKKAASSEMPAITYVRSAFFGSEEMHFEQPVPGCEAENMSYFSKEGRRLDAECNADGDAGFLALDLLSTGSWAGDMNFPNTGVEGYDDTSIAVTCSMR